MNTLNPNARLLVIELRKTPEQRGYRQGRGQLHRASDGARCCLGVACELYIKAGHKLPRKTYSGVVLYGDEQAHGSLPRKVQKWLGFQSSWGAFNGSSLQSKNDNGSSFRQIADIIERKPDGLFVEGK